MGEVSDGLQAVLVAIQLQNQSIERLVAVLEKDKAKEKEDALAAPTLIQWMDITGEERLAAWDGLVSFVEKIVVHYELQWTIRPCWWQHTDAIEELTALWHSYQAAYADPSNLEGAMTWRDAFSRGKERLKDFFLSCRDGHIDMAVSQAWMTDDVRLALRQAIDEDVFGPATRTPGTGRSTWSDTDSHG
jgi:Domain of unknown function (DUF4913)